MKKILFILTHLLSIAQFSTIEEIVIIGNKTTLDNTILNYVQHNIGDTINVTQAIDEQLNLYETGLFYDVTILPASKYIIFVSEKPKILPKPRFDKHDILGWSYGASILFNNIQGENKKLQVGALTGKTVLYDLKYSNPLLSNTKDSLTVHVYKKYFMNIEEDYSLDRIGFYASLNFSNNIKNHNFKLKYQYDYHNIKEIPLLKSERIYSIETFLSYINKKKGGILQKRNVFEIDYSFVLFN